jgi:hypothetical protein
MNRTRKRVCRIAFYRLVSEPDFTFDLLGNLLSEIPLGHLRSESSSVAFFSGNGDRLYETGVNRGENKDCLKPFMSRSYPYLSQ